jgi:hypothetical protein
VKATDYVHKQDSDGRHVLEPDLVGGGVQVYIPGDDLPESVATELYPAPVQVDEPSTKPVRKTTKPRRAATK